MFHVHVRLVVSLRASDMPRADIDRHGGGRHLSWGILSLTSPEFVVRFLL